MSAPRPPFSITRRGLLRLGASGAALGALGQLRAVPASASALAATSAGQLRFFDERSAEILVQVVERLVDTGDPTAPAVRATAAISTIDALCAGLDPVLVEPLPLALRLVEWGPLLFELSFSRFSKLSAEAKDASLRGWMQSRFEVRRMAFHALRNLAFLGYWSQPETWPLVGYQGPLLVAARSDA